jgi:hypothetical protein
LKLSDFDPLLAHNEDTYISLEYMPVDMEDLFKRRIKSFPQTKKGADIDELTSLIGQLDLVVTACTTVVYIAGALGVPCYVLVPSEPGYRYHLEGDFPWYNSVHLIRQEKGEPWVNVMERAVEMTRPKPNNSELFLELESDMANAANA